MTFKLSDLAGKLGLTLKGEDKDISGVATLEEAGPGDISFLANPKYIPQLATTLAGAVVVHADHSDGAATALISPDPYRDFSRIMYFFARPQGGFAGISHQAFVHPEAELGQGCTVYPFCYIGSRARLADGVTLFPGCYVGEDVSIGPGTVIYPNVSIMAGCKIGEKCIIHAGVVLGADGFGFVPTPTGIEKIPQVGVVRIGNQVEIGANTTIDRASLGETLVEDGCKIDNLVQLGHNVRVGRYTMLVSQTGIAGSTRVGERVIMAGQAGIGGHLNIGDGAVIGPKTGIGQDVPAGQTVMGMPPMEGRQYLRYMFTAPKLMDMVKKIKQLEKDVADLRAGAFQVDKNNPQ